MARYRFLFTLFICSFPLYCQNISIDWENRVLLGCNVASASSQSVVVSVHSLNDHLYNYKVAFDVQASIPNDFGFITPASLAGGARLQAVLEAVEGALGALSTVIKAEDALTAKPGADGKFRSVKLSETQAVWRSKVADTDAHRTIQTNLKELRENSFPDAALEARRVKALAEADKLIQMEARILSPGHTSLFNVPITPGVDNTIKIQISEFVGSQLTGTSGQPNEFVCVLKSNVLTLSAGILMSTVGSREYNVRAVPKVVNGVTQSDTYNALAVDNRTNLQPVGVALLNYQLPRVDWLSASAGPTFKLSGTSGTSTFGFFSGVSVNLWKRLYLTPGVHMAQFADFPLGYSEGSFVPPNLGTPIPVKRWTLKFGFGISFRATDFGGLDLGVRSAPARTNPAPAPAKP